MLKKKSKRIVTKPLQAPTNRKHIQKQKSKVLGSMGTLGGCMCFAFVEPASVFARWGRPKIANSVAVSKK